MKLVLDPCCGSRMFWFDRDDPNVIFSDIRDGISRVVDVGTPGSIGRKPIVISPDIAADFRNLPFDDESFYHVVFDPPHYHRKIGKTGVLAFRYGILSDSWQEDLRCGFDECFRVLRENGTLIFKWSSVEIPLEHVLNLVGYRPLYGHRSGKKASTHWVAFLKNPERKK